MPEYPAHYASIYISKEHAQMWAELHELADNCGVSMNRLVLSSLAICADSYKKHLPTRRSFVIEKARIVV